MIFLNKYLVDNLIIDSVKMEVCDLNILIACKNNVISRIQEPFLFIPPDNAYLSTILNGYGQIIGLVHENALIAFASVVFPKTGKNNLGNYLQFTKSQLKQVAQFEHGLVEENYRGHGLLKILLNEHLVTLKSYCNFLISTVSPYNIPSLKTAFELGQVIKKRVVYHGFDRFILYKQFNRPLLFTNSNILVCKMLDELEFYLERNYVAIYDFEVECYLLFKERNYETL